MQSRSRYLPSPVLVVAFLIVSAGLSSAAVAGGLSGAKQNRPSTAAGAHSRPVGARAERAARAQGQAGTGGAAGTARRARNAGAPGAAGAAGGARAQGLQGETGVEHLTLVHTRTTVPGDFSSASVAFVDAVCPAGMVAIAGSFGFDSGIVFVSSIGDAAATKWTIGLDNFGFTYTANVDVYANCAERDGRDCREDGYSRES